MKAVFGSWFLVFSFFRFAGKTYHIAVTKKSREEPDRNPILPD
jgi:hypothetical protein